jgi:hypothetical protein
MDNSPPPAPNGVLQISVTLCVFREEIGKILEDLALVSEYPHPYSPVVDVLRQVGEQLKGWEFHES